MEHTTGDRLKTALPALALGALVAGLVLAFAMGLPELASTVWTAKRLGRHVPAPAQLQGGFDHEAGDFVLDGVVNGGPGLFQPEILGAHRRDGEAFLKVLPELL